MFISFIYISTFRKIAENIEKNNKCYIWLIFSTCSGGCILYCAYIVFNALPLFCNDTLWNRLQRSRVRPVSDASAVWSLFNGDGWWRLYSHHGPGSDPRTPIEHAAIFLSPIRTAQRAIILRLMTGINVDYWLRTCAFLFKCQVHFSLCANTVISISFLHIPLATHTTIARCKHCSRATNAPRLWARCLLCVFKQWTWLVLIWKYSFMYLKESQLFLHTRVIVKQQTLIKASFIIDFETFRLPSPSLLTSSLQFPPFSEHLLVLKNTWVRRWKKEACGMPD